MCCPIGLGFCAVLVWKRVNTLPILVWNRVWFWRDYGSVWMYLFFQFQNGFEELFCLCSNLRQHNFCLEASSENRYGKLYFWVWNIGSGFGEPGSTLPPRIHRSSSPPPPGLTGTPLKYLERNNSNTTTGLNTQTLQEATSWLFTSDSLFSQSMMDERAGGGGRSVATSHPHKGFFRLAQ